MSGFSGRPRPLSQGLELPIAKFFFPNERSNRLKQWQSWGGKRSWSVRATSDEFEWPSKVVRTTLRTN